jgi:hypothetical protein
MRREVLLFWLYKVELKLALSMTNYRSVKDD